MFDRSSYGKLVSWSQEINTCSCFGDRTAAINGHMSSTMTCAPEKAKKCIDDSWKDVDTAFCHIDRTKRDIHTFFRQRSLRKKANEFQMQGEQNLVMGEIAGQKRKQVRYKKCLYSIK